MTHQLSPDGFYYRFDMHVPSGERLTRKRHMEQPWSAAFNVQTMTADELRFVAALIDDARVGHG